MFERFTKQARLAVTEAYAAAGELGHRQVGTDHVLLALVREADPATGGALAAAGVDADRVRAAMAGRHRPDRLGAEDEEALRSLGIDLAAVRERVEAAFGPGALDKGTRKARQHFTKDAKKSLELALREAVRLKHRSIGAEDLLLGIIRAEGDGYEVLRDLDVDLAALRRALESGRAA
ncbi:Clp protease N-terminal domain-containing protein [Nocardioides cheoyonin]|uniref:Clp protease N-terminal domain-containing protein n=1 Tax=Nocardioides cheoyonin TaxID=3156615 RepID=UPI0032B51E8D